MSKHRGWDTTRKFGLREGVKTNEVKKNLLYFNDHAGSDGLFGPLFSVARILWWDQLVIGKDKVIFRGHAPEDEQ